MTEQNAPLIMTSDGFTVVVSGKVYNVHRSHRRYEEMKEAVKRKDYAELERLYNISEQLNQYGGGKVTVEHGKVLYNGQPIHNALTERMLNMMHEGFDIDPMINFLENLMDNPSYRAVSELYTFLEKCSLPITPDGHFLAYKNVRENFTDIFSGKFDNSPGKVCEMPRNMVDEDKDRTCSAGLHFASLSYLPHFGSGPGGKTVIVKINPKDVVAIPSDYNNAKGRTCRYEVVGEHKGGVNKEAFRKTVHEINDGGITYGDADPFLEAVDRLREEFMRHGLTLQYHWQHKPAGTWYKMPPLGRIDWSQHDDFMDADYRVEASTNQVETILGTMVGVKSVARRRTPTTTGVDVEIKVPGDDGSHGVYIETSDGGYRNGGGTGPGTINPTQPATSIQKDPVPGSDGTQARRSTYLGALENLRLRLSGTGVQLRWYNDTTQTWNLLPATHNIAPNEVAKFENATLGVNNDSSGKILNHLSKHGPVSWKGDRIEVQIGQHTLTLRPVVDLVTPSDKRKGISDIGKNIWDKMPPWKR
jgi:hypothetical protein